MYYPKIEGIMNLHKAKIHYLYEPRQPESHLPLTLYWLHLSNQTMAWQDPRLQKKHNIRGLGLTLEIWNLQLTLAMGPCPPCSLITRPK